MHALPVAGPAVRLHPLAQVRDVGLQRAGGARRRGVAPERVDHPVGRHDVAAGQHQQGEHARAAAGRRARAARRPGWRPVSRARRPAGRPRRPSSESPAVPTAPPGPRAFSDPSVTTDPPSAGQPMCGLRVTVTISRQAAEPARGDRPGSLPARARPAAAVGGEGRRRRRPAGRPAAGAEHARTWPAAAATCSTRCAERPARTRRPWPAGCGCPPAVAAAALAADARARTAPTMPALDRYTGVVYQALGRREP